METNNCLINLDSFRYDARTNTVYYGMSNREVTKYDFSHFIMYIRSNCDYTPSADCNEFASYALMKRAFFRWLIARNNIPAFNLVTDIYVYTQPFIRYIIDLSSVCGSLKFV